MLAPFAQAAKEGEVVLEALHGQTAVEILKTLEAELTDKIFIDISNPLDFSKGMPPTLFVCNTDSLGEQIQKALPKTKVVKAFNTVNALLQVDPGQLAGGDHHLFGDITSARGMEMLMAFWLRLWGTLKTPMYNYKIVTQ